jgi:hypothetical protein
MTAATTGTAADHGPDLASVSHLPQRDSLAAMSSARPDEHGFRVKDIGVQ